MNLLKRKNKAIPWKPRQSKQLEVGFPVMDFVLTVMLQVSLLVKVVICFMLLLSKHCRSRLGEPKLRGFSVHRVFGDTQKLRISYFEGSVVGVG